MEEGGGASERQRTLLSSCPLEEVRGWEEGDVDDGKHPLRPRCGCCGGAPTDAHRFSRCLQPSASDWIGQEIRTDRPSLFRRKWRTTSRANTRALALTLTSTRDFPYPAITKHGRKRFSRALLFVHRKPFCDIAVLCAPPEPPNSPWGFWL